MANALHSSLLSTLLIFPIVLAFTVEATAGPENMDGKQPEWFFGSEGGTPFAGIGGFPLPFSSGNSGGSGGGYVPGGDDTFVPNPGNEIPSPASDGGYLGPAPAPTYP